MHDKNGIIVHNCQEKNYGFKNHLEKKKNRP
jgi:hypothetical protein